MLGSSPLKGIHLFTCEALSRCGPKGYPFRWISTHETILPYSKLLFSKEIGSSFSTLISLRDPAFLETRICVGVYKPIQCYGQDTQCSRGQEVSLAEETQQTPQIQLHSCEQPVHGHTMISLGNQGYVTGTGNAFRLQMDKPMPYRSVTGSSSG